MYLSEGESYFKDIISLYVDTFPSSPLRVCSTVLNRLARDRSGLLIIQPDVVVGGCFGMER